jgi:hypothetical protein
MCTYTATRKLTNAASDAKTYLRILTTSFGVPLAWPTFWKKFSDVLASLHTAPYIQHKLEYRLTSWQQHQGKELAWPSNIPPYKDTIGLITHMAFLNKNNLGGSTHSAVNWAKNGARLRTNTIRTTTLITYSLAPTLSLHSENTPRIFGWNAILRTMEWMMTKPV